MDESFLPFLLKRFSPLEDRESSLTAPSLLKGKRLSPSCGDILLVVGMSSVLAEFSVNSFFQGWVPLHVDAATFQIDDAS